MYFYADVYNIYIYICENSFLHMHSNTQICIHTPIQSIHTHIHIPVHIHLHLHEHIYACVHTCKTSSKWKSTYTYRYIEMYAYTCMFTYVRIEIYTCIKKYVHVQIHIIYIYTNVMVCKIENLIIHVSDLYILMRSHRWYRCSVFVFGMVWLPNSPVLRGWKKKFEHYVNRTFPWREMSWTCDKTRFPPKQSLGLKWKHIRGMVA